jgi:hypothetical protein
MPGSARITEEASASGEARLLAKVSIAGLENQQTGVLAESLWSHPSLSSETPRQQTTGQSTDCGPGEACRSIWPRPSVDVGAALERRS